MGRFVEQGDGIGAITVLLLCVAHPDQRKGTVGVFGNGIQCMSRLIVLVTKRKNSRDLRESGGSLIFVFDLLSDSNGPLAFFEAGELCCERAKQRISRATVARFDVTLRA